MNQCAFPDCIHPLFTLKDENVGEICHIKAQNEGGPRYDPQQTDAERHGFTNLLLLCRNHHKIIDDNPRKYSVEWLLDIKRRHEESSGVVEITPEDGRQARRLLDTFLIQAQGEAQVMVNSPGAVQARNYTKNVIIKATSKKQLPKGHPPGTIGADMDMHNYVTYLVKRFNEFRRGSQKTFREKKPFPYSAIHTQIESVFGNPTYYVPQTRFEELVGFLKARIDNDTAAGLRNQKIGVRSYHSFEEHKKQSRGET